MNVVSTVTPAARALDTVRTLATGSHGFVGKAAVEMEILDSLSTVRLVAAVDERAGGKTFEGMTSTWDDVEQALDYWAEKYVSF